MWHPRPRAEDVLCKRLLIRGEVDKYCHWHRRRRETADQLGENESTKKMKKTYMSVSKLKQQVTRSENDARFAAADRNRVASIEKRRTSLSASESRLKSLDQQSRSPSLCLIFTRRLLSRDSRRAIDNATGHARSGTKKYRTRSRKRVSGRRFKTRSVG